MLSATSYHALYAHFTRDSSGASWGEGGGVIAASPAYAK